ncbi:MAG: hypothetical protein KGH76_06375 [Thaumarchaeota archaeon]|nr:hypothetical protein [Nitrososphaerota archaeon]MDE1842539.1 hypothetical protein [Nitrososphaerota archaeon]
MKSRALFFIVPAGILLCFGIWITTNNTVNYLDAMHDFESREHLRDGIPTVCTNLRCVTVDDINKHYSGYLGLEIGLLSSGGIILVATRKWW